MRFVQLPGEPGIDDFRADSIKIQQLFDDNVFRATLTDPFENLENLALDLSGDPDTYLDCQYLNFVERSQPAQVPAMTAAAQEIASPQSSLSTQLAAALSARQ